jgi:hypothetical protein
MYCISTRFPRPIPLNDTPHIILLSYSSRGAYSVHLTTNKLRANRDDNMFTGR